jgi:cytochrome P450
MVLHPDVLAKAQAEVDRIMGSNRLPDLSDRDTLPYLDAIITETLRYVSSCNITTSFLIQNNVRWNPPAPLGRTKLFVDLVIISELMGNRYTAQGNAR